MGSTVHKVLLFPGLELRVSDLKQYAYCPRIVYYQHVMPVDREPTYKMTYGKETHAALEALERRRKLRAYGLDAGERMFHLWLSSPRLGLSGKLDLLIRTERGFYPVDFKFTEGRPRRNHFLQLAAYALLVEEQYGIPVERGFLYLIPSKDVIEVEITDTIKQEVLETIQRIREMVRQEALPPPTSVRARCTDCEYQNYCADIW